MRILAVPNVTDGHLTPVRLRHKTFRGKRLSEPTDVYDKFHRFNHLKDQSAEVHYKSFFLALNGQRSAVCEESWSLK